MPTAAELAIVLKAKDEASAVLRKVSGEVAGLGRSGDAANKGLGGLSAGFKAVAGAAAGIAVAVGGVTALAGAVQGAVGSAIDFEARMSAIKAVSGATGGEMAQLSKLALDLGKATSFSASEAAVGFALLVKGGVSVGDVFGGAASAALDLAAAGGVSVGEAATIAANALNQFNLKGSDMAHVADLVAGAANASSISVSDFNFSLAAVGAVAATAGQSFDSTATAIALLGQQGIKGSDAGTSLKAVLNNLIPTTDKATGVMKELGIITADGANQFIDSSGKMKGFGQIAEILQKQTADLTESQRLLALELIFGSDGMRAAGVLAKQGGQGFDALAAAMTSAGGAAEIARARLDNAAGDIDQLKGSLETAAITVGSLFIPAVRSIAQTATSAVNTAVDEFNTLRATAENISGAHGIGLIPAALTAVELRIGEAFGSRTQSLFHETRAAVEELAEIFAAVAAAAEALAESAGNRLAPALESVRQAAAGAGPVLEGLRDVLDASVPIVGQLTSQFADFLVQQGLVSEETRKLSGAQQQQQAVTEALWAVLRNNPIGQVIAALESLGAQIQSAQAATGELASATDRAWQAMIAAAGAVRDQVAAKLGELAAFIRGLGPALQADAVSVGVSIVNGIVAGLNPSRVIAASVALAQSAIAAARNALDSHSPSGEFEAIGEDVVAGLAAGIEGEAGEAVDAVADMVADMNAAAEGLNLVDAILGDLGPKGQDALANFLRDSEEVIEQLGRKSAEVGEKAARAIADAREDAARAIQDVREGAADRAFDLVDNQKLSRDLRAVRAAFGAQQDAAQEAYDRQREDAEDAYRFERDLAKAKTDDERAEVRARFREAQEDLRRRRQIEDDARAFKKQQDQALQDFNDKLEDEALQRQITRLQSERDERIAEITAALGEKERKILDQEQRERAALAQSATDKLNDLKARFFDKVGPLLDATRAQFETLFGSIAGQVGAAAGAVNALAEALSRAAGVRLPAGGAAWGDGATWENQTQAVRDMFTAAYGPDAKARWEAEHAQELGALGDLPDAMGTDPISGRPIGPGYYQPVPDTDYWRANWQRFNPLPWGTEYPPQAFGNYGDSNDLFGGNNKSTADYPDYTYAEGGVVPGPAGAARLATVHGGEAVFTPDQLAALSRYGYGGGGAGGGGGGAGGGGIDYDRLAAAIVAALPRAELVLDGAAVGRMVTPYVTGEQDRFASIRVR